MAVPKYQEFMRPILELACDDKAHKLSDTVRFISDKFDLSDEDRAAMIPSGTQTQIYNRVGWAITYLSKAGALHKPARGVFTITQRGKELLSEITGEINNDTLRQFDEFNEFKSKSNEDIQHKRPFNLSNPEETPEERIDFAVSELHDSLASEISEMLASVDPGRFEQIVVDLLVAMGYGGSRVDAAQVIGKPGDGGIDGTIKEDRLGLDVIYVQAKRWQGSVGRKEIQYFAGSLEGERASKGVFITTSWYTREAAEYVQKIGKRIILIDGERLARLMIHHGVGVSVQREIVLSKLDTDYFED